MEKDFLPTADKENAGVIFKAVSSWDKISLEILIQRPGIFILESTL